MKELPLVPLCLSALPFGEGAVLCHLGSRLAGTLPALSLHSGWGWGVSAGGGGVGGVVRMAPTCCHHHTFSGLSVHRQGSPGFISFCSGAPASGAIVILQERDLTDVGIQSATCPRSQGPKIAVPGWPWAPECWAEMALCPTEALGTHASSLSLHLLLQKPAQSWSPPPPDSS